MPPEVPTKPGAIHTHHQLHCEFTKKARKYEEQSRADQKFDFKKIGNLLANWHKDHILQYDVKFFQDLLEQTFIESIG